MNTLLVIDGWTFSVDLATTMEYSAGEAEGHCECAYCRNFYSAVDGVYPNLRPFLAQFGLDIEAPEELMPFEPTHYRAAYAVKGEILRHGSQPINVDGLTVRPEAGEGTYETWPAWFNLSVEGLKLPWVLNEPMEEVLSPANAPAFLERMLDKLLGSEPEEIVIS